GIRDRNVTGVQTCALPISAALRNQAGRQVLLTVRSPEAEKARDVIVTPVSLEQETDLRYDDWEYSRRLQVEELGKDDIGYVHLQIGRASCREKCRWKKSSE